MSKWIKTIKDGNPVITCKSIYNVKTQKSFTNGCWSMTDNQWHNFYTYYQGRRFIIYLTIWYPIILYIINDHIFLYISLYDRKYCYENAGIVVCMHTQWFPWYNFISSWPILLKFSRKDLWYIVMIGINMDYCSSTCFQTRGQRCDNECFWVVFFLNVVCVI